MRSAWSASSSRRTRAVRTSWPSSGAVAFDFGEFWFRGQKLGSGQCPVKRYNRALRDLIAGGKAKPSWIVSHELPLDQAPEGYEHFDNRDQGWTKVVLHPAGAPAGV